MMRKILAAGLLWLGLLAPAMAANVNIDNLPAAASVAGTNLFECEQAGTNRQCTAAQMAAYVYGLMSGDATASGGGAITLSTVNSNVGSFGSTTQCATITVNAKGLITAASVATCTPAIGSITGLGTGIATFLATPSSANLLAALTTKTGSGNAVFGTAPTISNLNATTGMTLAFITGSTQCLHVDTSGVVSGTGSDCGAGGGGTPANPTATAGPTAINGSATTYMRSDAAPAVQQGSSSQKGILQVDGTTITASSGVISAAPITVTTSVQSGTNYAFLTGDQARVIYLNNASAQTPTVAAAGSAGFAAGWFVTACNIGAGIQTITPATSTIGGAASLALAGGSAISPRCVTFISDGTNYNIVPSANTYKIASGTSALGTSAISSGACATVVTTSAPGVATTDVVNASFNGDPTAVTGYVPSASGMLTIIGYPTANNVNWKVCNNTSGSITPGAITLNWWVAR